MATAVLVPLAVIAVLVFGDNDDGPSAPAPAPSAADSTQSTVEQLRREAAVRDKEQIEDLTLRARSMVDDFTPVIVGVGQDAASGHAADRSSRRRNAGR